MFAGKQSSLTNIFSLHEPVDGASFKLAEVIAKRPTPFAEGEFVLVLGRYRYHASREEKAI